MKVENFNFDNLSEKDITIINKSGKKITFEKWINDL